jgi:N-acetyl-gamma-glutamyl-phosphate reductase
MLLTSMIMQNDENAQSVRVAVLGASGYSGGELLRLLAGHPGAHVVAVGASERAGLTVREVHPHLAPLGDLVLEELGPDVAERCDVVFLALPHGASAALAPDLLARGARVMDLAGDFRLPADEYPAWYGFEHPSPAWLDKAVYGLPELFRADIPGAQLVANPGCFATAAALALAPAARADMLGAPIIVDAKTGVSGAGAKPTATVHYAHTEGSVRPYRVATHQHTPEIERALSAAGGGDVRVTFVPHLVPAVRGVLVTCYAPFASGASAGDVDRAIHDAYHGEPFVRVLEDGTMPDPKRVAGTNVCEIGVGVDARTGTAIVAAALDNLVKGAAGQAIQNMNLLCGFDETTALPTMGLYP